MKLQQTATPVCLDSILKKILASGVPVELEADGSTSIHVKYLHKIFSCGVSSSSLLTAIREGTISVWSEEGGYLLTGNYNWDLVEHCRGLSQLGYDEFSDDDEWEGEEVIIKPYSHSNKESLENGLDIVDTEASCVCSGSTHHDGCDLVHHSLSLLRKLDSNDNSVAAHGSFPDIIKSTSLPRSKVQQSDTPSPPPPSLDDSHMTEESTEDASFNSLDTSSNVEDFEEDECMLTDSDDVFLPDNDDNTSKCVPTNSSNLQNSLKSVPITQADAVSLDETEMAGIICDNNLKAQVQSFNKNPLGKTQSCSSTNSTPVEESPVGSTMSISSSLCREFESLLTKFDDSSEVDAISLKSRQSVMTTKSDALTVSDILTMNMESKRSGRKLEEAASLNSMDVTLSDICKDVTSQTMDDAISDISGTEYESDTSDGDTLSTTSGEVSLCNPWERCESPNIEQMLGSFNRTDSFTSGSSQDQMEIENPNSSCNMSNQYIMNGYMGAVNGMPHQTATPATCSCSRVSSQRRYRKKHENKIKCTCSRKSRMMMQQQYQQSVYNDNNNNADLILINNVKSNGDKVVTRRSPKRNSPEKVLKKVSKRLSGSEFDTSDAASVSSDSSASSASTVVEVGKNKLSDGKLALLQFDDAFCPEEYDTFKNDLMWRWYNSKDESQIKGQNSEKSVLGDSSSCADEHAVPEATINKDCAKDNSVVASNSETLNEKDSDNFKKTHELSKPVDDSKPQPSSVLSDSDDNDVFLSDGDSGQDQKERHNSSISPIDDMLQNLCLMVDNEGAFDTTGQRTSGTKSPTRSNLRKDFAVYHSESQRTRSRNGSRNVRFAEVNPNPSRIAVVKPVMQDTNIHRSCLKKQKASTIGPCVQSLTDIHNDCFETPSIVERFYQRNLRGHHAELSNLSRSSPHLAMSSRAPKYTEPPKYENLRMPRYQTRSYERSQSVLNISQTGRVYETTKRCDHAVLLYGTLRPTPNSSPRKKNIAQPPAPPLPRPPSYEQHLQKYGLPRFLQSTKQQRRVEIPPSPIMAQFSTNRNTSGNTNIAQPAVVRRRDKKGMKLEPGGKKRHSTGSYIGMSQEHMQEDFSKEWKGENKKNGSPSSSESKKSTQGQRSKLKNRMIYFLLNL